MGRIEILAYLKHYWMELGDLKPSENRSTCRWAVEELAEDLIKAKGEDPYSVIRNFIKLMDRYSLKSDKTSAAFSTAKDIATDIYDRIGGK